MMRVLFLDADGVLNSKRWYGSEQSAVDFRSEHIAELETRVHPTDSERKAIGGLDPRCCKNLHQVLIRTGAMIVLSSSWRYAPSARAMLRNLRSLEQVLRWCHVPNARIIGRTPTAPEMMNGAKLVPIPGHPEYQMYDNERRSLEIQRWLDTTKKRVSSFAIVDDDAEMDHLAHRFVRTNSEVGLAADDVERLVALLTDR